MPAYETRLLRTEVVAERTLAFYLERPSALAFRAGQNALVSMVEPAEFDGFGPNRTLSFASAPHEAELMFATRIRDTAYKRVLSAAKPGMRMRVEDGIGEMLLEPDVERPAVFLAGGIGITPFLSMARHAAHTHLHRPLHLFYANRRPEDAPFLEELARLQALNPAFRFVATFTQLAKSAHPWDGERGPIGRAMLKRHLPDLRAPLYYLAGPPGMALGTEMELRDAGVAEDDIRSEEFFGY